MANRVEFIIRPNTVYNTRTSRWVFALLAFICLTIGIRFALLGYWMILPFAVVDIVAVGLVLLMLNRNNAYFEKIQFSGNQLSIRHVQKNNRQSWHFPVHWVRVNLEPASHRWYSRRLLVGSKGEWVEIGRCLIDSEREALAKALQKQIIKHCGLVAQD